MMRQDKARSHLLSRIIAAVSSDPRVIACLDYGSTGRGQGDAWSDLDLLLFIVDSEFENFSTGWQDWAAQFGDLLLAYSSFTGHPWAVYDTAEAPLRVDFAFRPVSSINQLANLLAPFPAAQGLVLVDKSEGALETAVAQLASKSPEPAQTQTLFTQACGDFWYMLLRCYARLVRGQYWAARSDFHSIALDSLMILLRIESGAGVVKGKNPSDNLETAISQERSARLRSCLPHSDDRDLQRAMRDAALFAEDVCAQIQQQEGWPWPQALAVKTRALLQKGITGAAGLTPVCMKPIGIVENEVNELLPPWEIKANPSRIIVDASLNEGLDGLSGGQRLLVVFQFHRLSGYELRQHPKNNPALPKRGVFALHSPLRPNPIGVTEVDLVRREGNVLHVRGLDAVNGTPVLDLKLNR